MARHLFKAAGEQFPLGRTSEAQIPPGWRSEQHKKGRITSLPFGQNVYSGREMARNNSLKFNELCANVYENKGSLLKTRGRTGNVVENKYSYADKAGMLLKIKLVSRVAQTRSLGLRPFLRSTADRQVGWCLGLEL